MNQLHILNGDATLTGFNETGLDGDVLVWREVFSEGPLSKQLDASFWEARQKWITCTFEDPSNSYQEMVLNELEKLNEPYDEITLWFEFDLHCQVNFLGVMQLLKDHVDLSEPGVYLVCPDHYPGLENFRGMGQLSGDQLEDLYDARLHLTEYDFRLAAEAWQKYNLKDASALQEWIDVTPFWGSLHLLKPALQAQVKRLQLNGELHGSIEQKLIQYYKNGITDRTGIYEAFWKELPIYGMGDAELDIYLNRLQDTGFISLQSMISTFGHQDLHSLCDNLALADPRLAQVIDQYGYPPFWHRDNTFETLVHIILEQQVSLASALSALNKLKERIQEVTPARLLLLTDDELKACYFSRQKTAYCRYLAQAIISGQIDLDNLTALQDDEIRSQLTTLKGIGNWTVDIYLLMVLHRTDVFPIGDLAIINAMKKLLPVQPAVTKEYVLLIADDWRPNRSIAAMLLWHFYLSEAAAKKDMGKP